MIRKTQRKEENGRAEISACSYLPSKFGTPGCTLMRTRCGFACGAASAQLTRAQFCVCSTHSHLLLRPTSGSAPHPSPGSNTSPTALGGWGLRNPASGPLAFWPRPGQFRSSAERGQQREQSTRGSAVSKRAGLGASVSMPSRDFGPLDGAEPWRRQGLLL